MTLVDVPITFRREPRHLEMDSSPVIAQSAASPKVMTTFGCTRSISRRASYAPSLNSSEQYMSPVFSTPGIQALASFFVFVQAYFIWLLYGRERRRVVKRISVERNPASCSILWNSSPAIPEKRRIFRSSSTVGNSPITRTVAGTGPRGGTVIEDISTTILCDTSWLP